MSDFSKARLLRSASPDHDVVTCKGGGLRAVAGDQPVSPGRLRISEKQQHARFGDDDAWRSHGGIGSASFDLIRPADSEFAAAISTNHRGTSPGE